MHHKSSTSAKAKASRKGRLVLQALARKVRAKAKHNQAVHNLKVKLVHPSRVKDQVVPLPVRVRRTRPALDKRALLALVQAVNRELFPFLQVLWVQAMAKAKDLKGNPELNKQARGRARILVRVPVGNLVFPVASKVQVKVAIAQRVT